MIKQYEGIVIFLIPPEKVVNGGIISIFSLAKESRRFENIHKSKIIISAYPNYKSYKYNDLFKNDEHIYDFSDAIKTKTSKKNLIIHIPEYAAYDIYFELLKYKDALKSFKNIHINILNQNIEMMPNISYLAQYRLLANELTQTTAHKKYCSQEISDKYYMPTHEFSVHIDEVNYQRISYEGKKKRILFSNDKSDNKIKVITSLRKMFPTFEFEEIKSVTYEQYKNKIREALYVITFGEGFDGYYIESIFSGTISFSVFNDSFFPDKSFLELSNIANNSDEFMNVISSNINHTNKKSDYYDLLNKNINKLRKFYNYNNYLKNIENFYRKKYTYTPKRPAEYYIDNLIKEYVKRLDGYDVLVNIKDKELSEKQASIITLEQFLKDETVKKMNIQKEYQKTINSTSWQITKPFRSIRKFL